jgi:hypothetical protein
MGRSKIACRNLRLCRYAKMCHLTASPRGWTSKGETGSVRDGTVSGHNYNLMFLYVLCHFPSKLTFLLQILSRYQLV